LRLISRLNHKSSELISWAEFLFFLESEGVKRETVNDAQIYGMGVKRFTEG